MFDFPASPTEGQVFTPPGGPSYVYKSPVWTQSGSGTLPLTGPIMLTGAVPEARIHFTQADVGFGVRLAGSPAGSPNRFVWNDKPDLSGSDVAVLNDSGFLEMGSGIGTIAGATGNGMALWARNSGQPNDGAHIGLRGNGYASRPNGVEFWTGGTGTAAFGLAGYFDANKSFAATNVIFAQSGFFVGAANAIILGNNAVGGSVYLRPNGYTSAQGQMTVDSDGNVVSGGNISAGGELRQANAFVTNGNTFATMLAAVILAANSGNVFFRPIGSANTSGQAQVRGSDGAFIISGAIGQKSTGTTWANPSDERIKNVVGDYEEGLAEIKQLQVRRYVYRGNDTLGPPGSDPVNPEQIVPAIAGSAPYPDSPHYKDAIDGTEFAGFVAQEIEAVMPAMVTQATGYIDGEEVADFRILDTNNLQLAMVNAIKELAVRVEALETA